MQLSYGRSMNKLTPRQVVGAFGLTRVAIGIAFAAMPSRLTSTGSPADVLMTRTFAVREVVLGVGGLLAATNATSRPTDLRLWAALGALTDGGDFCLALAGSRHDSSSTRLAALVAAAGLVCEAWALHAAGPNRRRA
jgi:hypothetical protein